MGAIEEEEQQQQQNSLFRGAWHGWKHQPLATDCSPGNSGHNTSSSCCCRRCSGRSHASAASAAACLHVMWHNSRGGLWFETDIPKHASGQQRRWRAAPGASWTLGIRQCNGTMQTRFHNPPPPRISPRIQKLKVGPLDGLLMAALWQLRAGWTIKLNLLRGRACWRGGGGGRSKAALLPLLPPPRWLIAPRLLPLLIVPCRRLLHVL